MRQCDTRLTCVLGLLCVCVRTSYCFVRFARKIVVKFTHHFGDIIVSVCISRITDTAHNGRARESSLSKRNIYFILFFPLFCVANVNFCSWNEQSLCVHAQCMESTLKFTTTKSRRKTSLRLLLVFVYVLRSCYLL